VAIFVIFFRSIRARFTGWYLVVLAVLLLAMALGTYAYLRHALYANLDRALARQAQELSRRADLGVQLSESRYRAPLGEVVGVYLATEEGYTAIATRSIEDSIDVAWVERAAAGSPVYATASDESSGQPVRYYLSLYEPDAVPGSGNPPPSPRPGERQPQPLGPAQQMVHTEGPAVLVVGRPMDVISSSLGALGWTLVIAVPLTLLLSAGGGLFLVRRALHPVDRMIETARGIEETDLGKRVDVQSTDELGRLGETFNAMLDRLERAFRRQRQFTNDASHELRSPLSVIEAEATLALRRERPAEEYRASLETIAEEAGAMNQLVDGLLALARGDAGPEKMLVEPVDLAALTEEIVAAMTPLAQDTGLAIDAETVPCTVSGDRVRLRRLLVNLIENAIRYTDTGGAVAVSVERGSHEALIRVTDTGIGIAPEHHQSIFERFARVDTARSRGSSAPATSGSGLGLAICRQIVELHGGTLSVESVLGEGSTFTVRIPVSDAA